MLLWKESLLQEHTALWKGPCFPTDPRDSLPGLINKGKKIAYNSCMSLSQLVHTWLCILNIASFIFLFSPSCWNSSWSLSSSIFFCSFLIPIGFWSPVFPLYPCSFQRTKCQVAPKNLNLNYYLSVIPIPSFLHYSPFTHF